MLSLEKQGDYLLIRSEMKLGQRYGEINRFFTSFIGGFYDHENYTWYVPTCYVDEIAERYEDIIAWRTTIEDIKGIEEVHLPEFEVSEEGLDDLKLPPRPFQVIGISFLHQVEKGIIADEMGLGKTLITMGAAHKLWREGKAKKVLVICPASLKYQWKEEIAKFTNHDAIVIDGTPKKRKKLLEEFQESDTLFCIVNYELVRNMVDDLVALNVDVAIADEAHRLKSRTSATYKSMIQIQPKYRFASTGTPMQNKFEELHSLMSWVDADVLGNVTAFRKRYIVYADRFGRRFVPIGHKRQGELRKRISPTLLRRMKKEVAPELPEMISHIYDIPMNAVQTKVYDLVKEEFQTFLEEIQDFSEHAKGQMLNGVWVQEKHPKEDKILGYLNLMLAIADDPYLLHMSDGYMSNAYKSMIPKDVKSPKIDELELIVKEQIESGNKIVIFTQFTRMQKRVMDRLNTFCKAIAVNGTMKAFEKQEAINRFKWEDYNVLVGTDAINYGVNLQFANVLIHMECPYNPAIVDQRNGRVHRIGGEHDSVNIIYLVTQNSIDEKIQATLKEKRKLSEQVIERNENERNVMNQLLTKV